MGFEEDRTHFVGSFGPNIDCDVTANALGARDIDRIQKYVRSSTNWGTSWTRSASSSDVFVYPLYDAHGNMVRTLSKTTNGYAVSAETVVDPWGTKVSSGTGEKRDYCASIGHVTDDESGLVYMRARYYEPGMGRFVSQDPARSGTNWYVYAENQPVAKVDALGLEAMMILFMNLLHMCFLQALTMLPTVNIAFFLEQAEKEMVDCIMFLTDQAAELRKDSAGMFEAAKFEPNPTIKGIYMDLAIAANDKAAQCWGEAKLIAAYHKIMVPIYVELLTFENFIRG